MTILQLPGTSLNVSAFCYGTAEIGAKACGADADRLLNTYRDAGGTFLDSAHVYAVWADVGAGSSERAIAAYFRRNGGRNAMVVATKGGHPTFEGYPRADRFLSADVIAQDVTESLARLETDVIDLYYLHRDDPRMPVGDIIEILNAEIRKGRLRYLGASNWQTDRIEAANAYARKHGLAGFVASQPQWSLAHSTASSTGMVFLSAADVAWHERSQLPVVCYSATARGFFATGAVSADLDNTISRERRTRACALATELGCSPAQIGERTVSRSYRSLGRSRSRTCATDSARTPSL